MLRHLLSLNDITKEEAAFIIDKAIEIKKMPLEKQPKILKDQTAVLIFDKPSTRTRSSFATGVAHFGGVPVFIGANESQMGRGEPVEDSARVLSSMFSLIIIRTIEQETVDTLAQYSKVPVINALTDNYHPCQILADIQTFIEHRGSIQGKKIVWIGDGNNVCHSWMNATKLFDFELHIATPEGFEPDENIQQLNQTYIHLSHDANDAVKNADLVITDTWVSMGQDDEKIQRKRIFTNFQVNDALMSLANKEALFMHCLPAYRGLEVTDSVLEGHQSVVWDEAENRLHAQKGLMYFLLQESAKK